MFRREQPHHEQEACSDPGSPHRWARRLVRIDLLDEPHVTSRMADTLMPRLKVFASYSHKDEAARVELEDHLSVLKDEYIDVWSDHRIGAGDDWRAEIERELDSADVILLLISAQFLASRFIKRVEVARALERRTLGQVTVIPVIAKACDWQHSAIGGLQAVPKGGKPLSSWNPPDEGFADAVGGIRETVERIRAAKTKDIANRAVGERPSRQGRGVLHQVPRRNLKFTGRDDLLNGLRDALVNFGRQPAVIALVGSGGVGKTSLATEYAHLFAQDYDLVWWIRSEDPVAIAADLTRLAEYAGVGGAAAGAVKGDAAMAGAPTAAQVDRSGAVRAALDWLRETPSWLLVFDNANTPGSLIDYLPPAGGGHVVITSRSRAWGGVARVMDVEALSTEEAVRFLVTRLGASASRDLASSRRLVERLGCVPLALELAASQIERTATPLRRYLDLLSEAGEGPGADDPTQRLSSSLRVALAALGADSPATQLLQFCAWLAPQDIPRELITESHGNLPPQLAAAVTQRDRFAHVLADLQRSALANVESDLFSIHPVIQLVIRESLDTASQGEWLHRVIEALESRIPKDPSEADNRRTFERYLAHAMTAAAHAQRLEVEQKKAAAILWILGDYQYERAHFLEARAMLDQALALAQAAEGLKSALVADILNSIGNVLDSLGDLSGARRQYESALAINREIGPEGDVATRLNNLGHLAEGQGLLEEAHAFYVEALAIDKRLGNMREAAKTMVNLGSLAASLGRFEEAERYLTDALEIDRSAPDPENAEIATDLSALGELYLEMGRFEDARRAFTEAFEIDVEEHGWEHPAVADDHTALVRVYLELGEYARAERHLQRALGIQAKVYGTQPMPDRARTHYHQGRMLEAQGRKAEALEAYKTALRNDDASDVEKVTDLIKIGRVSHELGSDTDARAFYQHAYRLCRGVRGLEDEQAEIAAALRELGVEVP